MFKLLTEEHGRKVAHKYALHRAIIMLSALIFILAAGIIGLLPSYVLSSARENEALERTRIMETSGQRGDEAELQAWLVATNRKLALLSPQLDTDRPSDYIGHVIGQKLTGVRLTGFSWIKGQDQKLQFSVDGIASDRQSLIDFENRISSSPYFADVTLPLSNLARDRDINFQIKFTPAPAEPILPTP